MIVIFQPLPVVHYLFFGHLLYDFLIYTSKQNFTVFGDTPWGATSLNSDRNVHAIVTNFSQNLGLNKGCTSSIWKKKRNTAWGLMWNSLSHISMYNVLYNVQCTMFSVQWMDIWKRRRIWNDQVLVCLNMPDDFRIINPTIFNNLSW